MGVMEVMGCMCVVEVMLHHFQDACPLKMSSKMAARDVSKMAYKMTACDV
jgi:hypothetical protein